MRRYRRLFLLAAFLLAGFTPILAQQAGADAEEPPTRDTCRVGIYILSIYDLDYPNQSFSADFWLWFLYERDSLDLLGNVEISNAKSVNIGSQDVEKKRGVNW